MSSRRYLPAAVAAVVALVVVVALAAVVVPRWWRGDGGTYAPRRMLVRTSVTPPRSLFGAVVTATLRVVVDPRRIDPSSVGVAASFRPFSVRTETDSTGRIGRARVRTFTYELQCLARACLPRRGGSGRARVAATELILRRARVTARTRAGKRVGTAAEWPPVGVQSRLTPDELALAEPHPERPLAAPPVTWRFSPGVVGGVASVLALLALLGAGALVVSVLAERAGRAHPLRIPGHLTPVERAFRLAEHATRHGETEESRKALERLAAELRRRGAVATADDAERLAWSPARPTAEDVGALREAVRSNGAH